jgi:hypothetical protein
VFETYLIDICAFWARLFAIRSTPAFGVMIRFKDQFAPSVENGQIVGTGIETSKKDRLKNFV